MKSTPLLRAEKIGAEEEIQVLSLDSNIVSRLEIEGEIDLGSYELLLAVFQEVNPSKTFLKIPKIRNRRARAMISRWLD